MNMRVEEDDDKGAVDGGARRGHTKRVAARLGLKADHTFDYKDIGTLKYFITDRGKIVPVRVSGLTARQQRSPDRSLALHGRGLIPVAWKRMNG